ncbi:MAG: BlaI/MecI/CopY family transcriptional regulator [Verrucomicrobiota bacterium]
MNRIPSVSESEWKVMEVLWKSAPASAREVIAALAEEEDWAPKTVKTLLSRLVKKGALQYEIEGNRYFYRPAILRSEAIEAETNTFLGRLRHGSLAPLLSHFVKAERSLDEEELKALRELLRQGDDQGGES